jgi:sarcosine oxidase subunit alpha
MTRLAPPRAPVTMLFDGAPVVAERGEPVAVALVAAGHLALARSPKFHRPRGPSCFRSACDGCLARVDGVPNVMTCRIPSREGLAIETQNVVGSNETDLLRVADWFFPEGMNHHELLAGVPGLQRVFQGFARRVAGIGRLPDAVVLPGTARRREVDVLVVGAGPAGIAVAAELAGRGREVHVVDDDLAWGGSARVLESVAPGPWRSAMAAFARALAGGRVQVSLRTTAAGVYGDDVLLATDADTDPDAGDVPRVEVVRARTLVLAQGAHDGGVAFEGNDVPGVMSARAACRLLAHQVAVGSRVVVARIGEGGPFGRAYAAARPEVTVVQGTPVRVSGSARVKAVTFGADAGAGSREGAGAGEREGERRYACDALLLDAPGAPAYELASQAGAELSHDARGFVVRAGRGGRIRDGVFAVGEAVGTPLEPEAIARSAREMAAEAAEAKEP